MSDITGTSTPFVPFPGRTDVGSSAETIAAINRSDDETAKSQQVVPPVLWSARQQGYHHEFLKEFEPVGPTEHALVSELARQCAAVDRWGAGALAVARQAAGSMQVFGAATGATEIACEDSVLAASLSTEVVDRCERHSLARSRAFQRALQKLEEIQARRKQRESTERIAELPSPFADEAACEQYLADRFCNRKYRCTACSSPDGCLIAGRRTWECRRCHRQVGLRSGTVMARSGISLWRWTEAIRLILWQPTIGSVALAEKLGIRRLATIRTMARRIRKAMAADDASDQLIGLDRHFSRSQPVT